MRKFQQIGGGACTLCGSNGTNRTNCPYNPDARSPNFLKHPEATDHSRWSSYAMAIRAAGGVPAMRAAAAAQPVARLQTREIKIAPPQQRRVQQLEQQVEQSTQRRQAGQAAQRRQAGQAVQEGQAAQRRQAGQVNQAAERPVERTDCRNDRDFVTMDDFTDEDQLIMDQDGYCYTTDSFGGLIRSGSYLSPATKKPFFTSCALYEKAMRKAGLDSRQYLGKIAINGQSCGKLYSDAALQVIHRDQKLYLDFLEDMLMIIADNSGGAAAWTAGAVPDYVYAQKIMDKYTSRHPTSPINELLESLLYLGDANIKTFTDFFVEVRSNTSCSHQVGFEIMKSLLVAYTIYFNSGISRPFKLPPMFITDIDCTNILIRVNAIYSSTLYRDVPYLIMYKFNEKNEKASVCNWMSKMTVDGTWTYISLSAVAKKVYTDDPDALAKLKAIFAPLFTRYIEDDDLTADADYFRFQEKYESDPEFKT